MMKTKKEALLIIEDVSVAFRMYRGGLKQQKTEALSCFRMVVWPGEIVAVVGASGAGKSLLAATILGILPENASISGRMYFQGEELTPKRQAQIRGRSIAYIPQSVSCLDPLMKIGGQVQGHRGEVPAEKVRQIFRRLELPEGTEKLYPHQLSGGMARRVLAATALVTEARLVIADEPTPGMGSGQAQETLTMFREMADAGRSVLLITHDVEPAMEVADRMVIVREGVTVETVSGADFKAGPKALRHPYSKALWSALPENGFVFSGEM